MKTKVIWLIDGLGPGGAEQLMTTLLKFFDREQYEMRICALQDRGSDIIIQKLKHLGIPVDFVYIKHLRDPLNIFHILAYLKEHQPDIIHTQLEFSDTLGNIAAKLLGIPSVSTLHTIELPQTGTSTYWRHQLRWFSLRNFCARIIAVSDKTREHHIRYGKLPQNKTVTLYNGIDLNKFQNINMQSLEEKRQSLNHLTESQIICTVAVLREPKGIQYMIKALPTIIENIPNATYLVIGDGAYKQELQSLAKECDVEEHVIFAGHRTDIPELLALSEVFVLPTLGDALPTVLIEAMAAKIPIVASEVGGVPEIVTHEKTGLLIPPADSSKLANACLQILQSETLAKELTLNAFEVVQQKFNVQSQVKQLSDIYQQLKGG